MNNQQIIWQEGRGLRRRVRQLCQRLGAIWHGGVNEVSPIHTYEEFMAATTMNRFGIVVLLPGKLAFYDRFEGRTRNYIDLQNIVSNQVDELSPISIEPYAVFAGRVDSAVDLLFVRVEFLEELEKHAGLLGIQRLEIATEERPDIRFLSPTSEKQKQSSETFWVTGLFALIASIWLASNLVLMRMESTLIEIKSVESDLRRLAADRSEENQQVSALESLADNSIDSMTVVARLETMAELRDAMPGGAWWLEVAFLSDALKISGIADNAAKVLQSVSAAYPEEAVAFSEPIIDEGEGQQSYVIEIRVPE